MAGAAAIIALIDQAPVFAPADPGAFAEAVRLFGLSELDAEIKALRTAEGLARKDLLAAAAERLAELVAAGALHEAFARAAIMDAAGSAGLIGSIGLKGVKAAISGAWKLGRKHPRDLSHLGFQLAQPLNQSRPRIAAGNVSELSSQPAAAAAPPPTRGNESTKPPKRENVIRMPLPGGRGARRAVRWILVSSTCGWRSSRSPTSAMPSGFASDGEAG